MTTTTLPARRTSETATWVALGLLVVGGVNWGLVGLFGVDLVATIFGSMSTAARIVYILVGISAVYCAISIPAAWRRRSASAV